MSIVDVLYDVETSKDLSIAIVRRTATGSGAQATWDGTILAALPRDRALLVTSMGVEFSAGATVTFQSYGFIADDTTGGDRIIIGADSIAVSANLTQHRAQPTGGPILVPPGYQVKYHVQFSSSANVNTWTAFLAGLLIPRGSLQ